MAEWASTGVASPSDSACCRLHMAVKYRGFNGLFTPGTLSKFSFGSFTLNQQMLCETSYLKNLAWMMEGGRERGKKKRSVEAGRGVERKSKEEGGGGEGGGGGRRMEEGGWKREEEREVGGRKDKERGEGGGGWRRQEKNRREGGRRRREREG